MTTNSEPTWSIPVGEFLLGALAGGIAALLLAPYAGAETRRRIKNGFIDGKSRAQQRSQQLAHTIVDNGQQLVDAGKKKLATEVNRLDSAFQAGKTEFQRSASKL